MALLAGCKPSTKTSSDPDIQAAASKLPQILKQYRAAGLPWSLQDVPKKPEVQDEANAACYLASAEQELESQKESSLLFVRGHVAGNHASDEDELSAIWKLPHEKTMNLVELAASKSEFADLRKDSTSYFEIHQFVKLLNYRAEQQAQLGDAVGASKSLSTAWKLAILPGNASLFYANNATPACLRIVNTSLEKCSTDLFDREKIHGGVAPLSAFKEGLQLPQSTISMHRLHLQYICYDIQNCRARNGLKNEEVKANTVLADPIGFELPTTVRGRAELERILEFWITNQSLLEATKTEPQNAEPKLIAAMKKFSANPGSSYDDFRDSSHTPWGDRELAFRQMNAEMDLIDALQYHQKRDKWPNTGVSNSAKNTFMVYVPGTSVREPRTVLDPQLNRILQAQSSAIFAVYPTQIASTKGVSTSQKAFPPKLSRPVPAMKPPGLPGAPPS